MSYSSEYEAREKEELESPAQIQGRNLGYTVFERMKRYQEQFDALYVTSLRVKAVFGDAASEPFTRIRKCYGKVRVAAQMLYMTPDEGYRDQAFRQKLEWDVWDIESDNPDSIEQQIKAAIVEAEKLLAPYLKPV